MSSTAPVSPLVGVVMGSQSDWQTMQPACEILRQLTIPFEARILSAHRTPDRMHEYGRSAKKRSIRVIIAGAGGAAHLPGCLASIVCPTIPVLGVPVATKTLSGVDSLYSILQMPGGVPVPTFSIGEAGAKNAALHAATFLSSTDPTLAPRLIAWRERLTADVPLEPKDQADGN